MEEERPFWENEVFLAKARKVFGADIVDVLLPMAKLAAQGPGYRRFTREEEDMGPPMPPPPKPIPLISPENKVRLVLEIEGDMNGGYNATMSHDPQGLGQLDDIRIEAVQRLFASGYANNVRESIMRVAAQMADLVETAEYRMLYTQATKLETEPEE